jgi:multiple antibiotic resistance protein
LFYRKARNISLVYHIDGLCLCRAIPLQVFRYFDKRFPNIFKIGFDMLQARYTPMKLKDEEIKTYADDISITPLGIPMLCGPGAIANAIVLMQDAHSFEMKGVLIGTIALIYFLTFLILKASTRLVNLLGETGNNVMMRLMGLILMVIAVECFVSGVKPILTDIVKEGCLM